MSDMDYALSAFGPTEQDIEDAVERRQYDLDKAESDLARDAAFCEWVRRLRITPWSLQWSEILFRVVRAREGVEHNFYISPHDAPLAQMARAESWPYVLRIIADVMEREPFETGGNDARR